MTLQNRQRRGHKHQTFDVSSSPADGEVSSGKVGVAGVMAALRLNSTGQGQGKTFDSNTEADVAVSAGLLVAMTPPPSANSGAKTPSHSSKKKAVKSAKKAALLEQLNSIVGTQL